MALTLAALSVSPGMAYVELALLLSALMLALTGIARRLLVPYPILLVLGGLALAFVPGLPAIRLAPDLVFLGALPPILWAAAFFTSVREFKRNVRAISLLALGLVVATTLAVGVVAHALLPGISWAAAFALGAIVSPPDAVAATAVLGRLGVPRQVVVVLEGESLVNDASAIVLYRAAVAAMVTGVFSLADTFLSFLFVGAGGAAVGLGVGWLVRHGTRLMRETYGQIAITLLGPYVAWVAAERVHASGVIACVVGGIYVRRWFSVEIAPAVRLEARSVWELLLFAINGAIFILIGLQLAPLRAELRPESAGRILWWGLAITATAIAVRFAWVPLGTYLPRRLAAKRGRPEPYPPPAAVFMVAWAAMRGAVTLAAALALPTTIDGGAPLPYRSEIILISFVVIITTLLLQGFSLAPLARAFGLTGDDAELEREAREAREHGARAALAHVERLAADPGWHPTVVDSVRAHYERRLKRFLPDAPLDPTCDAGQQERLRQLRAEAHAAERAAVVALRNRGVIDDETLTELERELDVEALRQGIGGLVLVPAPAASRAWSPPT